MRIQNNMPALKANRKLQVQDSKRVKALEKLSSGYKINWAADDASGLAISEKMKGQIRGLQQASRNIQDGVSLINVADGVLGNISDMIHRVRELAIQSASDTNETRIDREAIQKEVSELVAEIDETVSKAEFNTIKLFDNNKVGQVLYKEKGYETVALVDATQAFLYADNGFEEDFRVVSGSAAQMSSTAIAASSLVTLNSSPPTYPLEGAFVVSVNNPDYQDGKTVYAILDFSKENADGLFDLDKFEQFYKDAFSGIAEFSVDRTSGAISINTIGPNGEKAHVNGTTTARVEIGARPTSIPTGSEVYPPGATIPTEYKYVNSSIFGAAVSDSNSTSSYNTTGIRTISASEYASISSSSTSTLLWDLIPNSTTFTFRVAENTYYNPTSGYPNGYYGSPVAAYHGTSITLTKQQMVDAGVKTLSEANTWLDSQGNADIPGTGMSISISSVFVERNGTVRMTLSSSASPDPGKYPPSVPSGKFTVAVNSRTTSYAYRAMYQTYEDTDYAMVTSTYNAVLSDKIGTLNITIGNVAGVSPSPSITVDFSNNTIVPGGYTFSNVTEMAARITDALNQAAFRPNPPRTFPPPPIPDNTPVAVASIVNGKLQIKASERSFSVTMRESNSDRPILGRTGSYNNAQRWNNAIRITSDSGAYVDIPIESGDYTDIDDFIAKNSAAFANSPSFGSVMGWTLEKQGTPGNETLLIKSIGAGAAYTVKNIEFRGGVLDDSDSYQSIIRDNNFISQLGYVARREDTELIDGTERHYTEIRELPLMILWREALPNELWIQNGANRGDGIFINLPRINANILGLIGPAQINESDAWKIPQDKNGITMGNPQITLGVMSHNEASEAIAKVDRALGIVSSERAQLGATSNRLEYTLSNVEKSIENLSDSESRIRDTDMAKEIAEFFKRDLITQATTAILAQANTLPQTVLKLLS